MNDSLAVQMDLPQGKKIYFASDFHFGIPDEIASKEREKRVCKWLKEIEKDAYAIFLVGDIFDCWMEYKKVVPKGNIRFLGTLAELSDKGIKIIFFTGNHDLWQKDYFQKELGAEVFCKPQLFKINGKEIFVAHGDGLNSKEVKYRIMKFVIQNPVSKFIYRQLHPDVGIRIANFFSRLGPKHKFEDLKMKPLEQEYQYNFALQHAQTHKVNYYILGHRHIPITLLINEFSHFINLGDWISFNTYVVFDGSLCTLEKY